MSIFLTEEPQDKLDDYGLRLRSNHVSIPILPRGGYLFDLSLYVNDVADQNIFSSITKNANNRFFFRTISDGRIEASFVTNGGNSIILRSDAPALKTGFNNVKIYMRFTTNTPTRIEVNGDSTPIFSGRSIFSSQYNSFNAFGLGSADFSSGALGASDMTLLSAKVRAWDSANDTVGELLRLYDFNQSPGTTNVPEIINGQDGSFNGEPPPQYERVVERQVFTELDYPDITTFSAAQSGSSDTQEYQNTISAGATLTGFNDGVVISGGQITSELTISTDYDCFIHDAVLDDVTVINQFGDTFLSRCELKNAHVN